MTKESTEPNTATAKPNIKFSLKLRSSKIVSYMDIKNIKEKFNEIDISGDGEIE